MPLAEALLRIPDALNADRLIREKLLAGNWERHVDHSASLLANAPVWALVLTGKRGFEHWTEQLVATDVDFFDLKGIVETLLAELHVGTVEYRPATVKHLHPGKSAEVVATDYAGMMKEAREYAALRDNIVVKIPMIEAGMVAVRRLVAEGIKVNVTLCFSSVQCLIAAKAGATFVSPFIGRLDDVGQEGMDVIREARQIFDNFAIETRILAASIRHPSPSRQPSSSSTRAPGATATRAPNCLCRFSTTRMGRPASAVLKTSGSRHNRTNEPPMTPADATVGGFGNQALGPLPRLGGLISPGEWV